MCRFSVHLNKTNSKTFCKPTCKVIMDTSTNKIGVPPEHVEEINTLIKAVEYKYNRYSVSVDQIYVNEYQTSSSIEKKGVETWKPLIL